MTIFYLGIPGSGMLPMTLSAILNGGEVAIRISSVGCLIRWAADLDTPFLRQLKQAGFIR